MNSPLSLAAKISNKRDRLSTTTMRKKMTKMTMKSISAEHLCLGSLRLKKLPRMPQILCKNKNW